MRDKEFDISTRLESYDCESEWIQPLIYCLGPVQTHSAISRTYAGIARKRNSVNFRSRYSSDIASIPRRTRLAFEALRWSIRKPFIYSFLSILDREDQLYRESSYTVRLQDDGDDRNSYDSDGDREFRWVVLCFWKIFGAYYDPW